MKKRGQIFILAALILILVLFLLISQSNVIREKLFADRFENIVRNYETEGDKLINSILETQGDPTTGFEMFSNSFVGYSTAQDPNLGTLYILNYQTTTDINVYNMNVEVKTIGSAGQEIQNCISQYEASVGVSDIGSTTTTIPVGTCTYNYDNINKVEITTADGFTYEFDIEAGKPQLNLVVKKDEQDQTKVYYKKD